MTYNNNINKHLILSERNKKSTSNDVPACNKDEIRTTDVLFVIVND